MGDAQFSQILLFQYVHTSVGQLIILLGQLFSYYTISENWQKKLGLELPNKYGLVVQQVHEMWYLLRLHLFDINDSVFWQYS